MKNLIAILSIVSLASCARTVHKSSSEVKTTVKSESNVVDTTKTSVVTEHNNTMLYGDTLTGNIYLPAQQVPDGEDTNALKPATPIAYDSLESAGIKVKVGISALPGGGYKANVQAIAKPVAVSNSTIQKVNTANGITAKAFSNTTQETKQSNKDTDTNGFPWNTLIVLLILALIGAAIFFLHQYFPNGKS